MSTTGRSASSAARVEVFNRQRYRAIDRRRTALLACAVLDRIKRSDATLAVTFIRDRAMRELNRTYRNIDAPTDVLSFTYHEGEDEGAPPSDPTHLGDVVISVETAERYANKFGIDFRREIDHLVIHGTLHLAGYDHEKDNGQMNRLERRLRRELLESGI
jgi:probable rRNA maturation factor